VTIIEIIRSLLTSMAVISGCFVIYYVVEAILAARNRARGGR
jgi:hypothetical protein